MTGGCRTGWLCAVKKREKRNGLGMGEVFAKFDEEMLIDGLVSEGWDPSPVERNELDRTSKRKATQDRIRVLAYMEPKGLACPSIYRHTGRRNGSLDGGIYQNSVFDIPSDQQEAIRTLH